MRKQKDQAGLPSDSPSGGKAASDENGGAIDITTLRLEAEEAKIKLEERNLLLQKAKTAMEALSSEVTRLKGEKERVYDLEERLQRSKKQHEDMVADYELRISQIEDQLVSARSLANSKDQMRCAAEEKIAQLEISQNSMMQRLTETNVSREKMEEKWILGQQKISNLEDDLTQSKAVADLYKIQMEELGEEVMELKNKLRESQNSRFSTDEGYKTRLTEISNEYELQLKTLRQIHDAELDRLRKDNAQLVAEARTQAEIEIQKATEDADNRLQSARQRDVAELNKAKEEFNLRLQERGEEVKLLRSLMEENRNHMDSLMKENENLRVELRLKSEAMDNCRVELASKIEEVKSLRSVEGTCVDLKEALMKEQLEKTQLSSRLEQATAALEASRTSVNEKQAVFVSLETEAQMMKRDLQELRSKADLVAELSRENERLKQLNVQIKEELQSSIHSHSDVNRDVLNLKDELSRSKAHSNSLVKDLNAMEDTITNMTLSYNDAQKTIAGLREELKASEALLHEHRIQSSSLREEMAGLHDEVAALQAAKGLTDREVADWMNRFNSMQEEVESVFSMVLDSMHRWDSHLTDILDGDISLATTTSTTPTTPASSSTFPSSPAVSSSHSSSFGGGEHAGFVLDVKSVGQLKQKFAVKLERIQLKIDRARRLRSIFDSHGKRILSSVQSSVDNWHEKTALAFHKISDAQFKMDSIRAVLERDRKTRESESVEVKLFREEVLAEHTNRMREAEQRYGQISSLLEQERGLKESASKQVEALRTENTQLQKTIEDLKADLRRLAETEAAVEDFSRRIGDIADENQMLSSTLDARDAEVLELTRANEALHKDRSDILLNSEKLGGILEARDGAIRDLDEKLSKAMLEIERLKSRQIDPSLAQLLRDSQSIIQQNGNGRAAVKPSSPDSNGVDIGLLFGSSLSPPGDTEAISTPTFKMHQSSNSVSSSFEQQVSIVSDFLVATDSLVRRSAELLTHYESTRGLANLNALEQNLYDLLEANSRLTLQAQSVAGDIHRLSKRLSAMSSSGGGLVHNYRSVGNNAGPSPLKVQTSSPPSYPGTLSHSHPPPSTYQHLVTPTSNVYPTRTASSSSTSQFSIKRQQQQLFRTRFSPSPASELRSSGRFEGMTSRSLDTDSALATPNTLARESASRLTKLGGDLQALARRLDAFDHSRR